MTGSGDGGERLRRGFILLLVLATGAGFLGIVREFVLAIVLAAVFAGVLWPLHARVRAWLWGRSVPAAALTLLAALLVVGLPLAALLGLVVSEAVQVSERLRPWIEGLASRDVSELGTLPAWLPYAEALEPYRDSILSRTAEAASAAGRWLVSNVSAVTQGTLGFLLGLFVMLYAMFFFLVDGPRLVKSLKAHLPLAPEDRDLVLDRGLTVTRASLKGILVIGSLQGLLVGAGMWACGLSGAAFWGAIVFVLSAIPGLGAPLIWVPASLWLMATGSAGWGVALAVWGAVVVGLVDNLLRPLIVGRDAKLPDLIVLISILGGISSFGAVGIVIGPILAALLDTVLGIYRRAFASSLPD